MAEKRNLSEKQLKVLTGLFSDHGYDDYKWIDPKQIIVSQWVRLKCMYGCPNYGRKAACPPNVPSISDCRRFFREYQSAVVFHLKMQFDRPEERFAAYRRKTLELADLERNVFLAGFERALFLLFGGCTLCPECSGERVSCRQPQRARPAPEAMGMDVYSTVRSVGYSLEIRTEKTQVMDRFVFLMVH